MNIKIGDYVKVINNDRMVFGSFNIKGSIHKVKTVLYDGYLLEFIILEGYNHSLFPHRFKIVPTLIKDV